ncbi:MAG: hypothetical protein ACRBN8_43955 [Nannocystales bacterium]
MSWATATLALWAMMAPEATSAEFRWDAPAGCPTEAAVTADLEAVLGRPLSSFTGRHISVIARARPGAAGWDLKLWTVSLDTTHERSLDSETCATAAEAAVVVAAMAIDPPPEPDLEPEPEPAPASDPDPTPDPAPTSPPDSTPPPAPQPRARPQVLVGGHGGLSWGAMPGVGATAGLRVGMQWSRLRVEVDARYAFVRDARYADNSDVGADLRHAFVVGRGCGVLRPNTRLQIPLCGGIEAGAILGQGVGLTLSKSDSIPWLAAQVRAGLVGMVHPRVGLSLSVEPYVPLIRPAFRIQPVGVLWRPNAGGIRGIAGLEIRL